MAVPASVLVPWLSRQFLSQRNEHGARLDDTPQQTSKRLQLIRATGTTNQGGDKLVWAEMSDGELWIDVCIPQRVVDAFNVTSAKSFSASSSTKDTFRLRHWRFVLSSPFQPPRSPLKRTLSSLSHSASASGPTATTKSRRVCLRIDELARYCDGDEKTIHSRDGTGVSRFRRDAGEAVGRWVERLEGAAEEGGEVCSEEGRGKGKGKEVVYDDELPSLPLRRQPLIPSPSHAAPAPTLPFSAAPRPRKAATTAPATDWTLAPPAKHVARRVALAERLAREREGAGEKAKVEREEEQPAAPIAGPSAPPKRAASPPPPAPVPSVAPAPVAHPPHGVSTPASALLQRPRPASGAVDWSGASPPLTSSRRRSGATQACPPAPALPAEEPRAVPPAAPQSAAPSPPVAPAARPAPAAVAVDWSAAPPPSTSSRSRGPSRAPTPRAPPPAAASARGSSPAAAAATETDTSVPPSSALPLPPARQPIVMFTSTTSAKAEVDLDTAVKVPPTSEADEVDGGGDGALTELEGGSDEEEEEVDGGEEKGSLKAVEMSDLEDDSDNDSADDDEVAALLTQPQVRLPPAEQPVQDSPPVQVSSRASPVPDFGFTTSDASAVTAALQPAGGASTSTSTSTTSESTDAPAFPFSRLPPFSFSTPSSGSQPLSTPVIARSSAGSSQHQRGKTRTPRASLQAQAQGGARASPPQLQLPQPTADSVVQRSAPRSPPAPAPAQSLPPAKAPAPPSLSRPDLAAPAPSVVPPPLSPRSDPSLSSLRALFAQSRQRNSSGRPNAGTGAGAKRPRPSLPLFFPGFGSSSGDAKWDERGREDGAREREQEERRERKRRRVTLPAEVFSFEAFRARVAGEAEGGVGA
ncbi:hypothetical protein JCM10207_005906 [Rhodosporidiobolus poonsookiae]